MPILSGGNGIKLMCGGHKVAKIYCAGSVVYASGNVCTYHVDGSTYQEEVDEGASCLSPTSFTIPEKSGYTFMGWSLENGGDALTDLIMADDPIELYAVWIETKLTVFAKSAANAAPTINKTAYYAISTSAGSGSFSVPAAGYVCFNSKGSGGGENSGYSYLHINIGAYYKKATVIIGLDFSKNSDTASVHVNCLQVTGAASGNGVFYWADSNGSEKTLTLTSSGTITMKHNTDYRTGSASRYWIKSIVLEV